jgi:hypothetical protein
MKRLSIGIFLCISCLFLCISCSREASLENVLVDANKSPVQFIGFSKDTSVIVFDSIIGNLKFDSLVSASLDIRKSDKSIGSYNVCVKDTDKYFHEVRIYKSDKYISVIFTRKNIVDMVCPDSSFIIPKGFLNKRLLFGYSGEPSEIIVLWQNIPLNEKFVTYSSKSFSVLVPAEATDYKQSYIRIFGTDGSKSTIDLRISLVFGIPEENSVKL